MNHSVNLVAITEPKIVGKSFSPEEFIAYCARVSNPNNQNNTASAAKLLSYCIKNNHWLIFEMVQLVIEIQCTRTIGRQILRHRSFSFQEFSQRYAKVTPEMFVPEHLEARLQDTKNRQNSISISDEGLIQEWNQLQDEVIEFASNKYIQALAKGVAKEQARAVLPEGLTMSKLYMSGTLRSWIHYCLLRMANGTQKEHQDIAKDCWEIILKEFPFFSEIFKSLDINELRDSMVENSTDKIVQETK